MKGVGFGLPQDCISTFADDVVLLASSTCNLQHTMERFTAEYIAGFILDIMS